MAGSLKTSHSRQPGGGDIRSPPGDTPTAHLQGQCGHGQATPQDTRKRQRPSTPAQSPSKLWRARRLVMRRPELDPVAGPISHNRRFPRGEAMETKSHPFPSKGVLKTVTRNRMHLRK